MKRSGKEIGRERLDRLKKEMERSLKGCRRIADAFNREARYNGENISIGKTGVYEIMVEMGVYIRAEERKLDGQLPRPPEPFLEFAMDFTEKVIAGGERAYVLDMIDKYCNAKIILEGHETQSADAVICSLEKFSGVFRHRGVTITVDNGKEFKNEDVLDYCSRNGIALDFVNKGHPWENAFVERDIRTLHEECLNLVWINEISEIQPLLDEFKQKSNRRPNMAFNYMSPLEMLSEFVGGKKNIAEFGRVLTREWIPVNVGEV